MSRKAAIVYCLLCSDFSIIFITSYRAVSVERPFMYACSAFDKVSARSDLMCKSISLSRSVSMKEVRLISYFALSCVLLPDLERNTTLTLFQLLGMYLYTFSSLKTIGSFNFCIIMGDISRRDPQL